MQISRPRIVFLNRCFWPDSEATGQLLTDLCEQIADEFEVHVVCGQPNHPLPDAVFLQSGVEVRNRVTMHRLRHTTYAKSSRIGRAANLVTFYLAAWWYLLRQKVRADVVITETDPFMLPCLGARFAKRKGAKHVCYLQDIYPDVAQSIDKIPTGFGWVAPVIRFFLRRAYHAADQVVVLGSCMQDRLVARPWSVPANRISVIPNWADCDAVKPIEHANNAFRHQHCLDDKFVVMHSGNMGLTQRLDVLLDATQKTTWPERAVLLLVGGGASRARLEQSAAKLANPDRVRFLNYQPREELTQSLSAADIHVVSMHEKITGCLCPSKLYGVLAAGRPVLAIAAPETDLCRTVRTHNLGWSTAPGDADNIAKTVALAASDDEQRKTIQRTCRLIAEQRYDRPVTTGMFQSLVNRVTDHNPVKEQSPASSLTVNDTEDSNIEVAPL